MPERDELDRLIDSELARYAEPRTGLEQRILARVDAETIRRPGIFGRWQRWILASAVAAIAIVALLVSIQRNTHRAAGVTTARTSSADHGPASNTKNAVPDLHVPIRPRPQMVSSNPAGRNSKPYGRGEAGRRPKLDVFPSPQPLSAEELALVAIATGKSELGRENLISSQRQLDAPLEISAIQIPDLTRPDEGNK